MIPYVILADAEEDLAKASRWYERQAQGLGSAFLAAVDQQLHRVSAFPLSYPKMSSTTHRSRLQRFPYAIIYRLLPGQVRVTGVLPENGDPAVAVARS